MVKSVIALTMEQKKVMQQMPEALKPVAAKMKKLDDAVVCDEVLGKHKLGEYVVQVKGDVRKYGEYAVPSIALLLGVHPNVLWDYRQFFTSYTRERVERLVKRVGAGGKRITFGHFTILASLQGTKALADRKNYEKAILAEGLSVQALASAVRAKFGPQGGSSGRNVRVPGTVQAGLTDMENNTKKTLNRVAAWDASVFDRVDAGVDLDSKTLAQLREMQKFMAKSAETIGFVAAHLTLAVQKAEAAAAEKLPESKQPKAMQGEPTKKKVVKKGEPTKKKVVKKGKPTKKKVVKKGKPTKKKVVKKGKPSSRDRVQAARKRRPAAK